MEMTPLPEGENENVEGISVIEVALMKWDAMIGFVIENGGGVGDGGGRVPADVRRFGRNAGVLGC